MKDAIFKFNETPGLGNAVRKIIPFCKLMPDMKLLPANSKTQPSEKEILSFEYVVGRFVKPGPFGLAPGHDPLMHGLAGHKWSRLCGFSFLSSDKSAKCPYFQFVYVPKIRNRMVRNMNGMHGWYFWQYISRDNKRVMSINDVKREYGFDVNAFVFSDVFTGIVPTFVRDINSVVDDQLQKLYYSLPSKEQKQELSVYMNAIKQSLGTIYDVQTIVTFDQQLKADAYAEGTYAADSLPKAGHAKVAYNADKTYGLVNLDSNTTPELNKADAGDSASEK